MFKKIYVRLFLISAITTISLLIALPKLSINMNNSFLKLDASLGGYKIDLFNGKIKKDLSVLKKGLDLQGGIRILLEANVSGIDPGERDAALESAKEVISRRVDLLGVTEPYVATTKSGDQYRILVEIPGLDNVTDAVNLIGQTAQLKFRQIAEGQEWTEDKFYDFYTNPSLWEDTGITGADLKGADVVVNQQGDIKSQGKPQIRLRFSNEGRNKFSELAKKNINKPVGLFLDQSEIPLSMPIVSPDLAKGLTDDPVISGEFDFETSLKDFIELIKEGQEPKAGQGLACL